jgi:hypothetical protein
MAGRPVFYIREHPVAPTTKQACTIERALEQETDPRILALLREGKLTSEPPRDAPFASPGRKRSGKVKTMRDITRDRARRQREHAAS